MSRGFGDTLEAKQILVCVGSGGVGKTTTAAALALESARRGKKTLVLTIDPARRLANSLGLAELGHDVQEVPADRLRAAGIAQAGGELHAMMLDQKRAFDEVVTRFASDPVAVQRILSNPVYAQISGSLAGSQEYAALAKLEELDEDGEYEVLVVDTPPTAHALDFLDAPQKLTQAIDSPAVDWFRRLRGRGSEGWSVVGRTGAYMLKRLSKFVGSQFLDDLAVFFTEFNDILGGFRHRAEKTFELLRQDRVGFVLVASPEAMAIREALYFHQRLVGSSMPLAGFVINKVHQSLPLEPPPSLDEVEGSLGEIPEIAALGFQPTSLRIAAEALLAAYGELEALAAADAVSVARLAEAAGAHAPLVAVPFFKEDIYSVERLVELGRHLLAPRVAAAG